MRKIICYFVIGVTVSLFSLSGSAQTVVSRIKIGGYSEGTAYVSTGIFAGNTVMMRGTDVVGYPDILTSRRAPRVLFDVLALPIKDQPRGIAYIPGTRRFVFAENGQPDRLILSDENGQYAGVLFFQFPDNDSYRPNRFEGMAYIPADSANYPDHLAVITSYEPSLAAATGPAVRRILFVNRLGNVDASLDPRYPTVPPDTVFPDGYEPGEIGSIAYQGNVLICGESSVLWKMDFSGNVVGDAVSVPNGTWFEGVTVLPGGTIIATDGYRKVWAFDPDLNPLTSLTRDVTVGLGINPSALAWNNDTGNFLLLERNGIPNVIYSVPATFGTKSVIANLDSIVVPQQFLLPGEKSQLEPFRLYGMVYRDDVDEIALSYYSVSPIVNGQPLFPSRARIVSFDNSGQLVDYQRLQDAQTPMVFSPSLLSYIPPDAGESRYVMRGTAPEQKKLKLASPADGTLREIIDLAPQGISGISAIEYFNTTPGSPGGGRFLVLANGYRAVVTAFDGSVLTDFDYREKLGILMTGDLAYISTGTLAGAFATIANGGNEIVIFYLEDKKTKGK
jgi:hypothetical protein